MKENPHILRLFLDSPLDVALTKYQAMNTLGRSYAGLLIFIEGLRKLNLINEVVYLHYKNRYMNPLRTLPEEEPQTAKQKQETEKATQDLRKKFKDALELFPKLKPASQQYFLKQALGHTEFPESIEILRRYRKANEPQ